MPRYSDKYRPSLASQPTLKRKDLHQPFFPQEVFEDYFNPKKKKTGEYCPPLSRITLTSRSITQCARRTRENASTSMRWSMMRKSRLVPSIRTRYPGFADHAYRKNLVTSAQKQVHNRTKKTMMSTKSTTMTMPRTTSTMAKATIWTTLEAVGVMKVEEVCYCFSLSRSLLIVYHNNRI